MKYNFDELIDRRNTNAVKIDEMKDIWGRDNLIPMWVADMDRYGFRYTGFCGRCGEETL